MSLFKEKPLKKLTSDKRVKIDVTHTNILKDIKTKEVNVNKLKKELENYNDKYVNNELNENDIKNMYLIKNKLNKHDSDKYYNYYHETGLLLSDYYDNKTSTLFNVEDESLINKYKTITNFETTKKNYDIKCPNCNINYLIRYKDSDIICKQCGYTKSILINSEKSNYKEPPKENSYFAYKRMNHFNEWLAQFQAKETTDIPNEIYDKVKKEIKKENIDIENVDFFKIKNILKKLKLSKYYEHSVHIMNTITGRMVIILDNNTEEKLRNMFQQIQTPFINNCPENRKNFLSYAYVLHKFCELLELDHLLKYFPYLKSREKLYQQDVIWKKICEELQWEYIASI